MALLWDVVSRHSVLAANDSDGKSSRITCSVCEDAFTRTMCTTHRFRVCECVCGAPRMHELFYDNDENVYYFQLMVKDENGFNGKAAQKFHVCLREIWNERANAGGRPEHSQCQNERITKWQIHLMFSPHFYSFNAFFGILCRRVCWCVWVESSRLPFPCAFASATSFSAHSDCDCVESLAPRHRSTDVGLVTPIKLFLASTIFIFAFFFFFHSLF